MRDYWEKKENILRTSKDYCCLHYRNRKLFVILLCHLKFYFLSTENSKFKGSYDIGISVSFLEQVKTASIRKKQLAVFSKNGEHVETTMQLANALLLLIIFSSTLSPHPASFRFWQALSNCLVILLNLLQDSLFFFFSIFQCLCLFLLFFF